MITPTIPSMVPPDQYPDDAYVTAGKRRRKPAGDEPHATSTMMVETREHHMLLQLLWAMHDYDVFPNTENQERVLDAYRKAEAFFWGVGGLDTRYAGKVTRER